jgi:hypothetical protein
MLYPNHPAAEPNKANPKAAGAKFFLGVFSV